MSKFGPCVAVLFALTFFARPAFAQTSGTQLRAMSDRGFVGVGVFATADDTTNRVARPRATPSVSSSELIFEAGLIRIGRLGVGAEFVTLGTAQGGTESACCSVNDEERESMLLGMLRLRALQTSRLSVDLVGGIGVLSQHRETSTLLRSVPTSATTSIDDRRSPAYSFGVEAPVMVVQHLAIVPSLRLRYLQRDEVATTNTTQLPSHMTVLSVTGRVTW